MPEGPSRVPLFLVAMPFVNFEPPKFGVRGVQPEGETEAAHAIANLAQPTSWHLSQTDLQETVYTGGWYKAHSAEIAFGATRLRSIRCLPKEIIAQTTKNIDALQCYLVGLAKVRKCFAKMHN